ncbi:MAG TPA: 4Fe-4S dicluster domain-containing protein [Dehalococcoidia bacterium]|nr:4Fe-4S dicluster domain-containing protein [Dehalococcoidia bacterium]
MEAPQHSGSSYIVIDAERCKGCHLCVSVCPKGIIAPASYTNQKGYILAEVIAAKAQECTGCTACALICPDAAISVYRHSRVLSPAAR